MADQKEQVERLFAGISSRDEAVIRQLFAEDAVLIEGATRLEDPKAKVEFEGIAEIFGFLLSVERAKQAFRIKPTHHIQEGNWIATAWTVSREIAGTLDVRHGVDIFQFEGKKIVYGKAFNDLASLPPFRNAELKDSQAGTER